MANPCGINGIDNVQRIPIQLLQNPNGFSIESTEKEVHINGYMLIDAVGNIIHKDNATRFYKKDNFSQGLYFVQVDTNLGNKTFKVIF